MNLSKEQREDLVMKIQAALGILIVVLSVWNSAKVKSKEMQKSISRRAKLDGKLEKQRYKWKKKLLAQSYKQKLAQKKLKEEKNK